MQVEDARELRGIRHPLPAIVSGFLCGVTSDRDLVIWLNKLPIDFAHFAELRIQVGSSADFP